MFNQALYSQQDTKKSPEKSTTFKVCKVDKASQLLPTKSYEKVVIKRTVDERNKEERIDAINKDTSLKKNKWELINDKNFQPDGVPIRIMEDMNEYEGEIIETRFHPFMNAMHTAYAKHYPMTISPDMIWLLIAQGFATHINQNGEEMRDYFVDFDGKKNLDIRRDYFVKGGKDNDWEGAFTEWSHKIEENTGPELLNLVSAEFSTTGIVEKAAFEITLMDAMKSYFTYSMTTMCGIPEITLEGSVDDWRLIEEKAQALAKYDLDWWIDGLMPILKEFTKAAKGKSDREFWQSIYKWNSVGSGNPYITGWILNFFPYMDYYGEVKQFIGNPKINPSGRLTAETDIFMSGMSQADFNWNYYGRFFKMEILAGFMGYEQDKETLSLKPVIGWAVLDKQQTPTKKEIEAYFNGGDEEYLKSKKKN